MMLQHFPHRRAALLASVPDLVHAFEVRAGAARLADRAASRRRAAQALTSAGRLFHLRQVHGATVAEAPWDEPPEADAAVAQAPGQLLAVESADCLPLLLVDPRARRVAAVHAGWRGTAQGVAVAAARALHSRGSRPQDLLAVSGPAIGPCCYQVGADVRAALGPALAASFRGEGASRFRLDLADANRRQLEAFGIPGAQIQALGECTFCHPELYPSYRREGGSAGRLLSVIGFLRT